MNQRTTVPLLPKFQIPTVSTTSPEIHWDFFFFLVTNQSFSASNQWIYLSLSMAPPLPALCHAAKLRKFRDGDAGFCILSLVMFPCPWESFGCENWLVVKNGRKENSASFDLQCCLTHDLQPGVVHSEPGWLLLDGVKYFHAGSNFIFPQHICKKTGLFH